MKKFHNLTCLGEKWVLEIVYFFRNKLWISRRRWSKVWLRSLTLAAWMSSSHWPTETSAHFIFLNIFDFVSHIIQCFGYNTWIVWQLRWQGVCVQREMTWLRVPGPTFFIFLNILLQIPYSHATHVYHGSHNLHPPMTTQPDPSAASMRPYHGRPKDPLTGSIQPLDSLTLA